MEQVIEIKNINENKYEENKIKKIKNTKKYKLNIIEDKLEINILILKNKLENFEILNIYNINHLLIKIKVKNLLKLQIGTFVNWEYNRPHDEKRCLEIAKFMFNNKEIFDSILYLNYNNRHENFEIYDGIHRYMSILNLNEKIDENIINKNEEKLNTEDNRNFYIEKDENLNWYYESDILCNIRFNINEDKIKEIFKSLNKCLPVSELYIRDFSLEKTSIINELVLEFEKKYRKHFTFSRTSNIGNTNRTDFENLLSFVYDKYRININNIHIFRNKLTIANEYIKNNIPKKAINKKTTLEKCEKSGCYLFLLKNNELEELI